MRGGAAGQLSWLIIFALSVFDGCALFQKEPGQDVALGRYHYQLAYGYLFEAGNVPLAYQEILKSVA
ncbi:MAG: hypothetical protein VYD19_10770, partial [Myxococcota bacterium]|nr:hypothetical protein [Myxococcota bacterium]